MKRRTVITVDGLAGSGKTTIARLLAEKLGFIHMNSGLLYRTVGYLARRDGLGFESGAALAALVRNHNIALVVSEQGESYVEVDGAPLSVPLTTPEASEAASRVAQHEEVRIALVSAQQNAFAGLPIVAEGRDMGTVIFPAAQLKFFIQASPQVRAERRLAQLLSTQGGDPAQLRAELEREIVERDRRDTERSCSPTVAAADALIIDNSGAPLTEVIKTMYDAALNRQLAS